MDGAETRVEIKPQFEMKTLLQLVLKKKNFKDYATSLSQIKRGAEEEDNE